MVTGSSTPAFRSLPEASARYHQGEANRNRPVSSEISGYAASILTYLFRITGDQQYLDAAIRTAHFLVKRGWDAEAQLFPFEPASNLAYFFDSGIIIRGLLAVWRETKEDRLLDIAITAAKGMGAFQTDGEFQPVLELPAKSPAPRTVQWSRSPGCYQSKSALAWWELGEITGDRAWSNAWSNAIEIAIANHIQLLAEAPDLFSVVDRLHAYCYFLEALTPHLHTPQGAAAYAAAMTDIAARLRHLAGDFSRADVYAQLLRARLNAANVIPLDIEAAHQEAEALKAFQSGGSNPHLRGGFLFGQRGGVMSQHASPVPTTFAIQALTMWEAFQTGAADPCPQLPI